MKIAIDAMGGDDAPEVVVRGVIDYFKEQRFRSLLKIILVGKEKVIRRELKKSAFDPKGMIDIVDAREEISMREHFLSYWRRREQTSIKKGLDLVKKGVAQAMISAGNTGAVMSISKNVLGNLKRIERPALALMLPTPKGHSLLLDAGANVDSKPKNLVQFALMGKVFLENVYGVEDPKIALMSIGEEEVKGNELTKKTFNMLKSLNINFIGNVEGSNVYSGEADLIVTDGFTGNVALKVSEGVVETMQSMLMKEMGNSLLSKAGFFLLKSSIRRVRKKMDYAEYGGALLLGINGLVIVGHGKSSAKAIKNAIYMGKKFVTENVLEKITVEAEKVQSVLKEYKYV
ncbi:MAG: phosphate acyltransferase PlsX [Candidatus Aminicenantes bacterium]|nr:phosphate acyltransferase PlsX [Candidatus Aminicenantes bacterium]